ncbi:hypothetical protein PMM47T1_22697 [Pseudomonas sp. M47T1]|uniref:AAA family ATPase n=1 Tax=Pseudomonas sp. TaxID=306 RepID=UPI0002606CA2|nr:hypothetical protein PMM47T1_22697 [Pseudomonas sp. M47T1]
MIKSIHIENFKSYKNQTLPLAPLTLMIGANAAGKSNALECLPLSQLAGTRAKTVSIETSRR